MKNISVQTYVKLRNGVEMPLVGLGTFPLKGQELQETIRTALKIGYRNFDTASAYKNESDIGDTLHENSAIKDVFITTKLSRRDLYWSFRGRDIRYRSVCTSFKQACKRLKTTPDLYLLHQPYPNYVKLYKEMVHLYEKGDVRAIGVANFKRRHIEDLIKETGLIPHVNQIEINPYNSRKDLIDYCREKGIQVEAYSPFGCGIFTQDLLNESLLIDIAKYHHKSVAQIILRWIIQQNVIVIPRTSKPEKLLQNIQLFDFSLSDDEIGQIGALNKNLFTGHGKVRVEQDDMIV